MMVKPKTKITPKIVKKDYNSKVAITEYTMYADVFGLWESEKIVFDKYIKKEDKVLNVGCGAGRTTFGLIELGFKNIISIDFAKGLINSAKKLSKAKNVKASFEVGDATSLRFANNSFDAVIFSFNGLMCIPKERNRQKALKEIYRVLKPGGTFIFTTYDRHHRLGSDQFGFWEEERIRWTRGKQDKFLNEFGDRYLDSKEMRGGGYIYIPTYEQVAELLADQKFRIIFTRMRSEICKTPPLEKEKYPENRFWVVRK